jgi:hypothetical protein
MLFDIEITLDGEQGNLTRHPQTIENLRKVAIFRKSAEERSRCKSEPIPGRFPANSAKCKPVSDNDCLGTANIVL